MSGGYRIGGLANAPHNTNILDMTGGTAHVLLDIANSRLKSNNENNDTMIDFSGTSQNGYINFDDTGGQVQFAANIEFLGPYQFRFDSNAYSYIQNDGSNNFNIANNNGPIFFTTSDHFDFNGNMSARDITLSYGNSLHFGSGGGGGIDGATNIYANYFNGSTFQGGTFYGDGSGLYNLPSFSGSYYDLSNVPMSYGGGTASMVTDLDMNVHVLMDGSGYIRIGTSLSANSGSVYDIGLSGQPFAALYIDTIKSGSTTILNVAGGQQSASAITTAGFTANTSANAVFAQSTFTGNSGSTAYTISDIVRALKNYGLFAA